MLGDLLAVLASLVAALTPPAAPLPAPTPPPEPVQPVPSVPPPPPPAPAPAPPVTRVNSTAYCLTGRMADGTYARVGAVASNRHPLGTHVWLEDSPWGPGEFVVEDRIGWGSELDVAMPGDCAGARRWGRRSISIAMIEN